MQRIRGRWMLHEVGSAKLQICANAFYQECLNRLQPSPLSKLKYLPWMASPQLSRLAVGEMLPQVVEYESRLDFTESYLASLNSFIGRAIGDSLLSVNPEVIIFKNFAKQATKSGEIYTRSIELVERWSVWQRELFKTIVKSIIPVCKAGTYQETGEAFSDHHFVGAIFTSIEYQFPYPDLSLNISFAHELGHQALMVYQHSGDMLFGSDAWVYSGVRRTERPIVSSLHASVALAYMIEAIRSLLQSERDIGKAGYLHALLDEYTSGLKQGLSALAPFPKSELCEKIVEDLEMVLD